MDSSVAAGVGVGRAMTESGAAGSTEVSTAVGSSVAGIEVAAVGEATSLGMSGRSETGGAVAG